MVTARRRHRPRGLTLIEVMVALLVTTVALLGALATVGITVRGANFSRNTTEASILAQSKLESAVSQLSGTSGGALPTPPVLTENNIDANGSSSGTSAIYTRTTTWTQTLAQRTVVVDVSWPDAIYPSDTTKAHHVIASRTQDLK